MQIQNGFKEIFFVAFLIYVIMMKLFLRGQV